ncbi:MAG: FecR domain-containing protein [Acidobacteria bacterium]|nr:FecR domain-containing protein [Acidobacteriota bacterium]
MTRVIVFVVVFAACGLLASSAPAQQVAYSFEGKWAIRFASQGDMGTITLKQSGNHVTGTGEWDKRQIEGTVVGQTLTGTMIPGKEYPTSIPVIFVLERTGPTVASGWLQNDPPDQHKKDPLVATLLVPPVVMPPPVVLPPSGEIPCRPGRSDSGVRFSDLNGQVEVRYDDDEDSWRFAKLDMCLELNLHVKTGENSSAILSFADMTSFEMRPESEIVLNTPAEKTSKWELIFGNVWTNVKKMIKDGSMEVDMSQATAGIKGTVFVSEETGSVSRVKTVEGLMEFRAKATGETVMVGPGQYAEATRAGISRRGSFDVQAEREAWDETRAKIKGGGAGQPPAEPVAADRPTIQIGTRRVAAGDTVTVPVWLIEADRLASLNVSVTYQPNVVASAGAIAKGNLLDRAMFEGNPQERGTIYLGLVQKEGISGTGTIAQIPFKAVGAAGSKSPLVATVTSSNASTGERAMLITVSGAIEILGSGNTGPDTTPGPRAVPGDADGDEALTAADALLALKMSVRLVPLRLTADMDSDGQVTSNDARLILLKVVGR